MKPMNPNASLFAVTEFVIISAISDETSNLVFLRPYPILDDRSAIIMTGVALLWLNILTCTCSRGSLIVCLISILLGSG
ncbi:hypothetical protein N9H67_02675 [Methylophilaceae bacterium]|nr:hypothetical protein [Methylophilaceae bacterium]